jgi:hypothetical protein
MHADNQKANKDTNLKIDTEVGKLRGRIQGLGALLSCCASGVRERSAKMLTAVAVDPDRRSEATSNALGKLATPV